MTRSVVATLAFLIITATAARAEELAVVAADVSGLATIDELAKNADGSSRVKVSITTTRFGDDAVTRTRAGEGKLTASALDFTYDLTNKASGFTSFLGKLHL